MMRKLCTGSTHLLWLGMGLLLCLPTYAATNATGATIKCWRTKHGLRECGNAVPPEYAQSRVEILNDQGMVTQVIEAAKTEAELARDSVEIERIKAEERAKAERRERDRVLLQSYTTERDLNIARDQQLDAIQAIVDLGIGKKNNLQADLDRITKRAGDLERSGKPVPETLLAEMKEIKQDIKDADAFIVEKQVEKKKMADRFVTDIARFRELKGITSSKKP